MEYIIENGEVIITNIGDDNSVLIDIPEFIEGYPVTKIVQDTRCGFFSLRYLNIPKSINNVDPYVFTYTPNLTYINNVKLEDMVIINNNFIYSHQLLYKIKYEICGEYTSYNYYGDIRYFLEKYRYIENFRQ